MLKLNADIDGEVHFISPTGQDCEMAGLWTITYGSITMPVRSSIRFDLDMTGSTYMVYVAISILN